MTTTTQNITYNIVQKAGLGLQDLVNNPPALSVISPDQMYEANAAVAKANALSASSTEAEIQAAASAIIAAQIPYIQAAAGILGQFSMIATTAEMQAESAVSSIPTNLNIHGLGQLQSSLVSFQLSTNAKDKISQAISMANSLSPSSSLTEVQAVGVSVEYAQALIMQALVPVLTVIVTQMQLTPSQISQGNSVIAQINAINSSSTPGQINRILSNTIEVFAYIVITLLPQILSGNAPSSNVITNIRSAQARAQLNDKLITRSGTRIIIDDDQQFICNNI